ncbi:uncharacterized protein FIESC28_02877 [Fusarium coffeatum]|uniref:C2H2-type domain-containing protein n=1 Tax=Fusarium coffeatum TaxID=231269 RepID=A0A366S4X3_9HYPO|nr:uncharacterized protein FIESC28_02877 [Fusarium coffeatum]RBR24387.1 hypothetical protein FIESC28_02877 [Fusarium coffeatum]
MDSCSTCDRYFVNPQALKQHALSKHPETYCFRCERNFRHVQAKEQHIKASRNHWVCAFCYELDFITQKELKVHYKEEHNPCTECDTVFRYSDDLYEHELEEHNKCMHCGRTFGSESNLRNHLKTHKSKDIDCPGCEKMFISNSAMVLHLETGYCPSGADQDTVRDVAQDLSNLRQACSTDERLVTAR